MFVFTDGNTDGGLVYFGLFKNFHIVFSMEEFSAMSAVLETFWKLLPL